MYLVGLYGSEYFFESLFKCPFAEILRKLLLMGDGLLLAGPLVNGGAMFSLPKVISVLLGI
jgi:hypothetical protein